MKGAKELQKVNLRRLVRNNGFEFTDTFFPYASGQIGSYYVQSADILKSGGDFYRACNDMEDLVRYGRGEKIDVISGGETRDWMFSFPIAKALQTSHAMIYKSGKIYGADMKGKKVVHVADLNNEGSSPRDYWVPAIRKAGGDITQIFFYVDRMEDGVEEMKKLGLQSHALIPLDDTAWDILLNDNVINKDVHNSLRQRMENKDEWARNMLRSDVGLKRLAELTKDPDTTEKVRTVLCNGYPYLKEELVDKLHKKYGKEVTSKLPVFGL